MLPTKTILSKKIQLLIKNNKEVDSDLAIKKFGDELSKVLLDTLGQADVIMLPGSINTVLTVAGATGTGITVVQSIGNLQ